MPFKLSAGVEVGRDANGVVRHLNHVLAPFAPDGAEGLSPEALAAAYVREVADVYGLKVDWLKGMENRAESETATPAAHDCLRLAHSKTTLGTTVVSFVQMQ